MSRSEPSAIDRGEQEECLEETICGFQVTHHQAISMEDDAGDMEEGTDTKSLDRDPGHLQEPRVGGMKNNMANRDTDPAGSAGAETPPTDDLALSAAAAAASATGDGHNGVPATEIAPSISTSCVNTDTPTSETSNMDTEPKQEKTESVGLQSGPIYKCENLGCAGDENIVGLSGLTASLQVHSPSSFGSDEQEELYVNLAINVETVSGETCHSVSQQGMCELSNTKRDEDYDTENVNHISTLNTCEKEVLDESNDKDFHSKSHNARCSLKLDLNIHESQSVTSVKHDILQEVDSHNASYQLKYPQAVDSDRLNHNMDTTVVATLERKVCSVNTIEHGRSTKQFTEPTVRIDQDKENLQSFSNAKEGNNNTTSSETTVGLDINHGGKCSLTAQDALQDRTGDTVDAQTVKEFTLLGQAPLHPMCNSTTVANADGSTEREALGSIVCAGEDVAKWISPASRRLRINPFNNIPDTELNLEICENHFGESGCGPSSSVPGTHEQHIFPEVYVCSKGGVAAGVAPTNMPKGMWRMQDSRSLDGISQLYVLEGARPKEGRPEGRRATISSALELEGTVTHEGELTHFVADDLLQKIKLSSSRNLDDEEAGGAVPLGFLARRDIPPVDPAVLADLEVQARDLASNVDHMMKSLNTTIQNMTALSVGYIQTYRDSVDSLGESVDLSIKAMYTLMARTEELDKGMQPVHGLAKQIKDVKRLLDHLENLCK